MNKKKSFFNNEFVIGTIILMIFLLPAILSNYLNEKFELKKVMDIFNWFIIAFIPFYYSFYYIKEKLIFKKIEKKYIQEKIHFEYYRNIMEEYSPALLSLVYDGRISFQKDLMLSILYLKVKGYIAVENNEIVKRKEYLNNNSDLNVILNYSDCLLSDNIYVKREDGTNIKTCAGEFRDEWAKSIFKNAVDCGLVMERKEKKSFNSLLAWLLVIEGFFMMFINETKTSILAFFLAFVLFLVKYLAFADNQYPKTQKGYEVYAKLKGLKRFINHFSKLNSRKVEELELWEEYMIYTILLNYRTSLNKSFKIYYNDLKKNMNSTLSELPNNQLLKSEKNKN